MSAPWVQSFLNKYRAGVSHTFVLHHNIGDYVDHTNTLRTYLTKLFSDREIVVVVNKASGLTFPLVSHRENFEAATKTEAPSDPNNPLAAFMKQDNSLPKETIPAFLKIDQVLHKKRCAVIIEHAETIFPAADFAHMQEPDRRALVTLLNWAKDTGVASYGSPIILLANNLTDLHPSLRTPTSRVEAVCVPYPQIEERQAYIQHLLNEYEPGLQLEEGLDARSLANTTAGLNRILIEDIVLRALSEGQGHNGTLTRAHCKERKEDIIRSEFGDVLEIVEPGFGFEAIGGLEHVKQFIRSSIIEPLRTGDSHRCPMGVLMTGPAGTGKTAIAEATAKEAGVNFVNLNLARILGQYVGNSERNLEKALLAIDNLAPTIVLIDEIDQSVQRGGQGDSGVSNRIFKRLLEYMSSTGHRGKVVFLAATNRPDLMDAAMKRAGRFDKKIPFFPPDTDEEREAIFKALLTKYGIQHEIQNFLTACQSTEGYSGADLEAIVIKSVEIARDSGRETVTDMDLTLAARSILPSSKDDVSFMTDLALREVNDVSLVPAKYLDRVKALRRGSIQESHQRRCSNE